MNPFRKKLVMVTISAEAWDELSGLGRMTEDGFIDLSGIALAKGAEQRQEEDDPIARHRKRVIGAACG